MFDFTKEFTLKGKWWIPTGNNDESNGLYGELSFSPINGLELLIEGSLFETKSILYAKHNFQLSYLVGIIKERQFITLFNLLGTESGQDSWITTHLQIGYGVLCNEGYFALPGMSVTGINFNTNCFSAFFKGFRKTLQLNQHETSISFTYDEVPQLQIIKDNCDAYFVFSYKFKGLGMIIDEFSFTEKIYLNLFYNNPISLDQVLNKFNFYRDFFTFFSCTNVSFHNANIFTSDENGNTIKFALLFKDHASNPTQTSGLDILLSYSEISEVFSDIFQHWLGNEETIQSGLLLYLQTKNIQFPSPIQSFLNLVFALETLHNTYFNKKPFSQDDIKIFKQQREKSINFFDERFHPKITECLAHFNSISFNERLKDLILINNDLLSEFIYDTDDFCKKIKQQRNFLAHNHSERNKSVISISNYPYFIAIMKLIFECSFLPIIGVPRALIKLSIKRNYLYQNTKNYAAIIKDEFTKSSN